MVKFDSLREKLKTFDAIVLPVRFARESGNVWKKIIVERRQERQRQTDYRVREELIRAYLGNYVVRKLQIGTGNNPLAGWLNTDLEPETGGVIFLDAMERFPLEDQLFDYVFSEHMIEHIHYKAGLFMLSEAYRILKPGGKIRIATPNVERIVGLFSECKTAEQKQYISWSSSVSIGLCSPEQSELQLRRSEWAIDYSHIKRFFPDVSADGVCFIVNNFFRSYGHQFLYDCRTLKAALEEVGFIQVTEVPVGESEDKNLQGIESHGRSIGEPINRFETMVMEAFRP